MAFFKVDFAKTAEDDLRRTPFPFRRQLFQAIQRLKASPRPFEAEDMGSERYLLRVHGWSIAYAIDEERQTLTVFAVYPNED